MLYAFVAILSTAQHAGFIPVALLSKLDVSARLQRVEVVCYPHPVINIYALYFPHAFVAYFNASVNGAKHIHGSLFSADSTMAFASRMPYPVKGTLSPLWRLKMPL